MPAIALYPLLLLEIAGPLVTVFIARASFRRAVRSRGFNRCLYAYIAAFCGFLLGVMLLAREAHLTAYLIAQTSAWATLPLWAYVAIAARETRSPPKPTR